MNAAQINTLMLFYIFIALMMIVTLLIVMPNLIYGSKRSFRRPRKASA